jgi:hypothetical protein
MKQKSSFPLWVNKLVLIVLCYYVSMKELVVSASGLVIHETDVTEEKRLMESGQEEEHWKVGEEREVKG